MSEQTEKTNAFEMSAKWLSEAIKEHSIEESAKWLVNAIREHASGASPRWVVDTLDEYDRKVVAWIAPFAKRTIARLKTHSFRLGVVESRVVELGERKQAVERGPPGPPGPMPAHEWRDTKLRFQQGPSGEWGEFVDLQGPPGRAGGLTAMGLPIGIGGGGGTVVANSYFPAGW
jgi:hypothetical protein